MSIKLVAVDMDGTLLSDEKTITATTVRAVARAARNGVEVVLSTGRNYAEFKDLLPQLPDVRYAVTCTGASVLDCRARRELYASDLDADTLRAVYAALKPFDCAFEVFAGGDVYISEACARDYDRFMAATRNPAIPGSRSSRRDFDQWIERLGHPVTKVHLYFCDTQERDRAWDAVRDLPVSTMCADEVNLEIMAPGVDKGRGLSWLAGYLDVDASQVMAVGDSGNDAGMLSYAGTSVVMANGLPELKAQADIVADSNQQDGVAKLLDALIAGELIARHPANKRNLQ